MDPIDDDGLNDDDLDADSDEAIARAGLRDAIENQLADNKPEAAQATLNKLMLVGYSREDSIDLMAHVLAFQISEMFDNDQPFDNEAYEQALRNLPDLP